MEALHVAGAALACITNSVLASLTVRQHTRASLGNYRFLLLAFSVSNIIFALNHAIIRPVIYFSGNGFIYFAELAPHLPYYGGIVACCLFILMFYQTFTLLALHFVYRWNAICRPSCLRWICEWRLWRATLLLVGLVLAYNLCIDGAVLACCCPTAYSDDLLGRLPLYALYELDPKRHSYFALILLIPNDKGGYDWNVPHVQASLIWTSLVLATAMVIIFCFSRIRRAFKTIAMSARTRDLHRQLFLALIMQTLIPIVFSYIPIMMVFVSPITGIDLGNCGALLVRFTIIFPITDPIVVISLVKCLRDQMSIPRPLKLLACCRQKNEAVIPAELSFTTVVNPSISA